MVLSLLASAALPVVELRVHASAVVAAAQPVALGNIATLTAGPDACRSRLAVVQLPVSLKQGQRETLDKRSVMAAIAADPTLRDCHITWSGPARFTLEAPGVMVDVPSLITSAQSRLTVALSDRYADVRVVPSGHVPEAFAGSASVEWEWTLPDTSLPRSRMCVVAIAHEQGRPSRSLPLWFDVQAFDEVSVLIEDAPAGATLASLRFRLEKADVAALKAPAAAIGANDKRVLKTARRMGDVLLESHLSERFDVVAGLPVRLSYRDAAMRIEVPAVALQSGRVGDRVRVKNPRSNETVLGQVAADGHVEVTP